MATRLYTDAFGNSGGGGSDFQWPALGTWPGYGTTPTRTETMQPFTPQGQAAQIGPQTAQTNLAAAAQNTQLADLINAVNQAAQQAANRGRLGPGGEAIQNTLLENVQAGAAGVLDPTTEQMMRANIAARYGSAGMGVDSPALYSAYVRGTGQNIQDLENKALQNYIALLAANPSAPIFNMGELAVTPGVYSQTASSEAARQQAAEQFALNYALQQQQLQAQNQRAADQLAYQYAALAQGGRGGGGYTQPVSAAAAQTRMAPGTQTGTTGLINPFAAAGGYGGYGMYDQYIPDWTTQDWYKSIGWGGATEPETYMLEPESYFAGYFPQPEAAAYEPTPEDYYGYFPATEEGVSEWQDTFDWSVYE